MKKMVLCTVGLLLALGTMAQTAADGSIVRWFDPLKAGFPVVQGQAWPQELSGNYHRLPDRMQPKVTPGFWKLASCSAGLSIPFRTNADSIWVRYVVKDKSLSMYHMPVTGVSGLDLYAYGRHGQEIHMNRQAKTADSDTLCYLFYPHGNAHYAKVGYEFQLYLPLYNEVTFLEIGVKEMSQFEFLPLRSEKPIVAYGTSIMQGACASRPGMAWSTIMARKLDMPLLNFGFSGSGKMDSVIVAELGTIDACLYIVDCLPNLALHPDSVVVDLYRKGVALLRRHHYAPILLVEHAEAYQDEGDSAARHKNDLLKRCYEQLCAEGVKDLYYLSCDEIDLPQDALVDGIHPSDYGMVQQAVVCEKKVREILKMPAGDCATCYPIRQRREAPYYEWRERHEGFMAQNRAEAPKCVVLGNSIVHYWGGSDERFVKYGGVNWSKTMAVAGFRNLGCGYDRIENVLWRVTHGELDGYDADRVVIMIGTNNIGFDTDEDIVRGIVNLAAVVKLRQPNAQIEVIGLLPRRGFEERIARINALLEPQVVAGGAIFRNPGVRLLKPNGKINESLFLDGVHPNEKGYNRIGDEIAFGKR